MQSYLSVPFLPLACRISFSFFTTTAVLISVPLANILGFSWMVAMGEKTTKLKIKNTNNVLNKLLEASFSFYSHWFC